MAGATFAIRGYGWGGAGGPYLCSWDASDSIRFEDPDACSPHLSSHVPGTFWLRLTITDASGAQATDLARVTIGDQAGDTDEDGIQDNADNCASVPNHDQIDTDHDGIGDACDLVCDSGASACVATPSSSVSQSRPEIPHLDSDGVPDAEDNCPRTANADQADLDGDLLGDMCDADADGDGVGNSMDNCPLTHNFLQADSDGNRVGDACDGPTPTLQSRARPAAISEASGPLFSSNGLILVVVGLTLAGALLVMACILHDRRRE